MIGIVYLEVATIANNACVSVAGRCCLTPAHLLLLISQQKISQQKNRQLLSLAQRVYTIPMFRIITGSIVVLLGLGLAWFGAHDGIGSLVFGLVFAAIGVAILLNKQEDEIEEISNQESNPEHHE